MLSTQLSGNPGCKVQTCCFNLYMSCDIFRVMVSFIPQSNRSILIWSVWLPDVTWQWTPAVKCHWSLRERNKHPCRKQIIWLRSSSLTVAIYCGGEKRRPERAEPVWSLNWAVTNSSDSPVSGANIKPECLKVNGDLPGSAWQIVSDLQSVCLLTNFQLSNNVESKLKDYGINAIFLFFSFWKGLVFVCVILCRRTEAGRMTQIFTEACCNSEHCMGKIINTCDWSSWFETAFQLLISHSASSSPAPLDHFQDSNRLLDKLLRHDWWCCSTQQQR